MVKIDQNRVTLRIRRAETAIWQSAIGPKDTLQWKVGQ